MKTKFLFLITIATLILGGCSQKKDSEEVSKPLKHFPLSEGDFIINVAESKLVWTGKQLSTKEHYGTLNILDGNFKVDKNGLINGKVKIDMKTINTTDLKGEWKNKLDGHLKSPDFFDVNNHPIAYLTFQSDEKKMSKGKLEFDGQLTIKGLTHPISFSSNIKDIGGKLTANTNITFDRSLYNVKYGSGKFFENLGDNLIYDDISVDVVIIASK